MRVFALVPIVVLAASACATQDVSTPFSCAFDQDCPEPARCRSVDVDPVAECSSDGWLGVETGEVFERRPSGEPVVRFVCVGDKRLYPYCSIGATCDQFQCSDRQLCAVLVGAPRLGATCVLPPEDTQAACSEDRPCTLPTRKCAFIPERNESRCYDAHLWTG